MTTTHKHEWLWIVGTCWFQCKTCSDRCPAVPETKLATPAASLDAAVMARLRAPFGCERIMGPHGRNVLGDTPPAARWRIHDANDDAIASVAGQEEGYARLIVKALNEHFSGGLTNDEIVVACRNVGVDLNCGACASNFFTGQGSSSPHDATCKHASTTTVITSAPNPDDRPECENCGIVDKPLDKDGFCEGCVCTFCGAKGSMGSVGTCSDALDSFAACVAEQEACMFAVDAHGDQKYGDQPYVVHLRAVRQVLRDFGIGGDLGVAAWLHDVAEDTKIGSREITAVFGAEIAGFVHAVSGYGETRRERNAAVYAKLRTMPDAIPLKLADRIANVEACRLNDPGGKLAMYQREYIGFKDALTRYPITYNAMWIRLEEALFQKTEQVRAMVDRAKAVADPFRTKDAIVEAVRAWQRAECGASEADALLAKLAAHDDAIERARKVTT
jgi:guanosine-3',5'-bis(diphosphate) 3'-pyrophosphohydrolase